MCVYRNRRAPQRISQEPGHHPVLAHGHPLPAQGVVLADGAVRLFIVAAHVGCSGTTHRALDPLRVGVVEEARRGRPTHPRQPVLLVIGQGCSP
jgi:hypothetical protein